MSDDHSDMVDFDGARAARIWYACPGIVRVSTDEGIEKSAIVYELKDDCLYFDITGEYLYPYFDDVTEEVENALNEIGGVARHWRKKRISNFRRSSPSPIAWRLVVPNNLSMICGEFGDFYCRCDAIIEEVQRFLADHVQEFSGENVELDKSEHECRYARREIC